MDELLSFVIAKYNYWVVALLIMIGLYALIAKNNLVKKIIGMNIFQTAIIFFYITIGAKKGATIPIVPHEQGAQAAAAADFINPLPHVLMLTAIVVSVATLGVALALALKVFRQYGTLEEDDIRSQIRQG